MSTTLQELKNQIDAANELGVTNITKKGGTISSDATTAEIMAEIDNLPAGGGGSVPTIVSEITWDGNTEGLESATVTLGDDPVTFYKVSDGVLPFGYSDGTKLFAYTTKESDESVHTPKVLYFNGYVVLGEWKVVSALFANFETELPFTFPSAGTWFNGDNGDYYIKYVGAESVDA